MGGETCALRIHTHSVPCDKVECGAQARTKHPMKTLRTAANTYRAFTRCQTGSEGKGPAAASVQRKYDGGGHR